MKLAICAGPATTGKTVRAPARDPQAPRPRRAVAFLKIDVQYAEEDELLAKEFGIPTRKLYSGELCPDHCSVMVLGDAMKWAEKRLRHPAGRDRRPVPALRPLRRRRPRHRASSRRRAA